MVERKRKIMVSKRKSLPKDRFFQHIGRETALTFDDVRLRTGYSEVMPDDVDTSTLFSRHIPLKIPLVSAAMDTVTEYKMAIALAKLGGLGIIHRNLTPVEQAKQVARVKFHLNGKIRDPICVYETMTLQEISELRKEKGYTFHTFPVVDKQRKLLGVLTENDFDFCDDPSQLVRTIMSTRLVTSNSRTTIEEAYEQMMRKKKKLLPLVDKQGRLTGLYVFSDVRRIVRSSNALYNVDENGQLRVGAAIGVNDSARVEKLLDKKVDVVVIDTAHADTKSVLQTLKQLKKSFPSLDVVAGNISEPESAKRLLDAGADGIKVGQGGGSICTTRIVTGIGSPQVSAVYWCAKVAERYNVPLCADGGLRFSGDITIALAAGAHSVMLGSMLAGTDETPGDVVYLDGKQWKIYRGMGSIAAMQEHAGSRERYNTGKLGLVPEGIEGLTTYKGPLETVVMMHMGGLRKGMGSVGAADIKKLRTQVNFLYCTSAGINESHPHDVRIAREAPNYTGRGK
ncbi:MAG: IMP dehydrogenase [Candidatus Woesearchaeota archaeon]|nr:IMP dehydrogenase [Candidatus Woesearchaeota archaeon]